MSAVPAVSNPASPAKAIRARRWRVPFVRGSSAVIAALLAASIIGLRGHECGIASRRWHLAIGAGIIKAGRGGDWRDSANRGANGAGSGVIGCDAIALFWDQAYPYEEFAGAWRPFHRTTPSVFAGGGGADMWIIPTWQPLLFFACVACWAHGLIRGRRGIRLIRCGCGYDITGLRADPATGARKCPECGSAVGSP